MPFLTLGDFSHKSFPPPCLGRGWICPPPPSGCFYGGKAWASGWGVVGVALAGWSLGIRRQHSNVLATRALALLLGAQMSQELSFLFF